MPVFIFFLFIALVMAIVGGCIFAVKKRRQDLQAVARRLGMEFFPTGDERIAPMLSNLEFFMYGSRCKVRNLMRGQVERQGKPVSIAIFDYDYTICLHRSNEFSFNDDSVSISSNSDFETFCQTVLVFYDESLDLPSFSLRPEHLWDKLANLVGFEDINFDSSPIFSRKYRLLSNQESDVRDLFQPNLINFYEANQVCAEAIGPYLLIFPFGAGNGSSKTQVVNNQTFSTSRYIHPPEIKPYFDLGLRLLNLLEKNTSAVRR
jgi:hypothetical protein